MISRKCQIMKSRKRQEYPGYFSIITTMVYCGILWFLSSGIIYNMRNPELTKTEALWGVIKIIL
jgi:hypothetical protein